jgi:hypothetical protein
MAWIDEVIGRLPGGWRVERDFATDRLTFRGPNGEFFLFDRSELEDLGLDKVMARMLAMCSKGAGGGGGGQQLADSSFEAQRRYQEFYQRAIAAQQNVGGYEGGFGPGIGQASGIGGYGYGFGGGGGFGQAPQWVPEVLDIRAEQRRALRALGMPVPGEENLSVTAAAMLALGVVSEPLAEPEDKPERWPTGVPELDIE